MTTFKQSDPTPSSQGRSSKLLQEFREHLKANPGKYFEYPEIQRGQISLGGPTSGFTVTTRRKDNEGNEYRTAGGEIGIKSWGRFDPVEDTE